MTQHRPNLSDVPETMLWTLHNRAAEALYSSEIITDKKAIEIYKSIDYDYKRSFGPADASHAVRSVLFDAELQSFLIQHPNGVIINLGEGLETQRYRVSSNQALWLSVDVPEAIAIRERFIQPDEQHVHIAKSALDLSWMDAVPEGRAVYITVQGLFMYFEEEQVKQLIQAISKRFPTAYLSFDHIPVWLSQKTLKGWKKTPYYTTPPMPWGIDRNQVEPKLREWQPDIHKVSALQFRMPRGLSARLFKMASLIPVLKHKMYGVTRVQFGNT